MSEKTSSFEAKKAALANRFALTNEQYAIDSSNPDKWHATYPLDITIPLLPIDCIRVERNQYHEASGLEVEHIFFFGSLNLVNNYFKPYFAYQLYNAAGLCELSFGEYDHSMQTIETSEELAPVENMLDDLDRMLAIGQFKLLM